MNLKKLATLLLLTVISVSAFAQDWRQVGDGRVDLGPLHDWLNNGRKKDRPLPHWKQIHIMEFKSRLDIYDQCTVKLEDGQTIEVLISHIEPSVKAIYADLSQTREKAARIQAQIDAAERNLTNANKRQRNDINSKLKQLRKDLNALNKDEKSDTKKAENSKEGAILAMSTGRTYGGFPIWDCGVKIAAPPSKP